MKRILIIALTLLALVGACSSFTSAYGIDESIKPERTNVGILGLEPQKSSSSPTATPTNKQRELMKKWTDKISKYPTATPKPIPTRYSNLEKVRKTLKESQESSSETNNDPEEKLKRDLKILDEDVNDLFAFGYLKQFKNPDCEEISMSLTANSYIPEIGRSIKTIEMDLKSIRSRGKLKKDFDEIKNKFNVDLKCEESIMLDLDQDLKKKREGEREKELMNELKRLEDDVEDLFFYGTNCDGINPVAETSLGRIGREIRRLGSDIGLDISLNSKLRDINNIYNKAKGCF